jgi:15-cis-phytoene synthase
MAAARAGEPDRYLAALLAPADARPALMALAAFAAEIARVPRLVEREAAMGEVRLQWWRDALAAAEPPHTGNPVADAVRAAVGRHGLPVEALVGVIDARSHELYADPPADDAALQAQLKLTEGGLFALGSRILGATPAQPLIAACAASAEAYGLARLLVDLPQMLARGRVPLPLTRLEAAGLTPAALLSSPDGDAVGKLIAVLQAEARAHLAAARKHVADLPRQVGVAFLPLALVEPYLRSLGTSGRATLRRVPRVLPLTRIVRIAAAHWLRRL